MIKHFDPNEVEAVFPATYEGIAVGDTIKLTKRVADDLPAGATGIVTGLDNHKGFPVTVTMIKPVTVENLPLSLDELTVIP